MFFFNTNKSSGFKASSSKIEKGYLYNKEIVFTGTKAEKRSFTPEKDIHICIKTETFEI